MKLGKKQELFADLLGQFLIWIYEQGYAIRMGEVYRPEVTADHYARTGKGIRNSLHCKKLAADLYLVKDGKVTWALEDYELLGTHWESMHELCCWGGRFKNRDAVHFSVTHQGIK